MIYLDNAATTVMDGDVLSEMLPYLQSTYGNPQSLHAAGRASAEALLKARDGVAEVFGCPSEEVYFLSGGSEAGNLAVKGVCSAHGKGHIIVSAIEHPAVLESALEMQRHGFSLTLVQPDSRGIIDPADVERAIREDTVFCAVMAANNEIGTIQPVEEISKICARAGIFYYADCVQSVGSVPFPREATAFAVSAHKFHGPKGAAAIRIKRGSAISPLISGGRQERGLRGGTVNVAGAVGLCAALKKAAEGNCNAKIAALRDDFIRRVTEEIAGAHVNGDLTLRVPSNANISFDGCRGDRVLFGLDLKGVCVSTGSACSAGAVTPSRVVAAVVGDDRAASAVRFTFGKYNTPEEVVEVVSILKEVIK